MLNLDILLLPVERWKKMELLKFYKDCSCQLGNITAKNATLGGKLKGNVNSDKISIKKTAEIEGVLNQKTLSIEEGAALKIKTETYK